MKEIFDDVQENITFIPLAISGSSVLFCIPFRCKLDKIVFGNNLDISLDAANYMLIEFINVGRDGLGTTKIAEWTNETGAANAFAMDKFVGYELDILDDSIINENDVIKFDLSGVGVGNYPLGKSLLMITVEKGN
jgi:hypothetical protein